MCVAQSKRRASRHLTWRAKVCLVIFRSVLRVNHSCQIVVFQRVVFSLVLILVVSNHGCLKVKDICAMTVPRLPSELDASGRKSALVDRLMQACESTPSAASGAGS